MARLDGFTYNEFPGVPDGMEVVSLSDSLTYKDVQGFVPNITGTLAVEMRDGSSGSMAVVAGFLYPGRFTKFKSTGSSGVTSVTVFF